MKFFGKRYPSAAYVGATEIRRPIGLLCAHCAEPIGEHDDGIIDVIATQDGGYEAAFHYACYLRPMIGSVAHQQGRCSCRCPGYTDNDDPHLTPRQAAEAALAYFERQARR